MFPAAYYGPRYYAARYFPKTGSAVTLLVIARVRSMFDEDMAEVFNTAGFDEFAEEIIYTPRGGAEVAIDAIVTRNVAIERFSGGNPGTVEYGIILEVRMADVATPLVGGDTFRLAAKQGIASSERTFTLKEIISQIGLVWRVAVA